MTKIVTTRLPDEFVENINEIAEKESIDNSAAIRKLLAEAINRWRKRYALEQYKNGSFSFGQLARFAGISVWDVPKLLKENKIPLNYDIEEFRADLNTIRKWKNK